MTAVVVVRAEHMHGYHPGQDQGDLNQRNSIAGRPGRAATSTGWFTWSSVPEWAASGGARVATRDRCWS